MNEAQGTPTRARSPLDRIVCGIDGSDEGLEAARQAARLARESLTLVAVIDPWDIALAGGAAEQPGSEAPPVADRLRAAAVAALETAVAALESRCPVETRLVEGRPAEELLREAESGHATLVAVGTHGRGRLAGIALGSVATAITHRAPCSVLVARARPSGAAVPETLVVGVDGSAESALAAAIAREIHEELGPHLRLVTGTNGADPDAARAVALGEELELTGESGIAAVLEAAGDGDLVVVGSRGLAGVKALGSVSERVVHAAPCSVLVVRSTGRAWEGDGD